MSLTFLGVRDIKYMPQLVLMHLKIRLVHLSQQVVPIVSVAHKAEDFMALKDAAVENTAC
jgi:hypothetical protein